MPAPHEQHMRHALRLAARGLGTTSPNPAVGAVIVKDDIIIGRGWTARGGRPHAETVAIAQAGDAAKGATLYVSLEPCSHQGKTGPCADAIIKAGIKRVVAACTDPNPQVAGKGFEKLRAAGIEVIEKVCEKQALQLNEGFFSVIKRGHPFVTMKLATSLDGKITTGEEGNKWVTSEASRKVGHYMRATHDAILTGIGTVASDNPALTCRLPGREEDSPQRVVIDSYLKIPVTAAVLPAWIFTSEEALKKSKEHAKALEDKGCRIFTAPRDGAYLSLNVVLEKLTAEGVTRLMVEAGSKLATAFIKQNLVDSIYWFCAPLIIGDKGLSGIEGELSLSKSPRYTLSGTHAIGNDTLEIYRCSQAS